MLKNLLNRFLSPSSAVTAPEAAPAPVVAPVPPAAPAPSPADITAADALIDEGNTLEDRGELDPAEAAYRRAVEQAPRHARAHLNLGIVLAARGDLDGAGLAYEQVLAIDPGHAFGQYNYARLALVRGDVPRAQALIAGALQARPDFPQALVVQSNVFDALGQADDAVASLEAALQLQPDDAGAWFNLGVLLQRLGRSDQAESAVRRALVADPGNPDTLAVLGRVLRDQGFAERAVEPLRAANALRPDHWALRSLELLMLNFVEGVSADALFRRHVEFGAELERAVPVRFTHPAGRLDASRRLRVGYLSGDLMMHTVAFFLIPVLEHHDRTQVEVFCYSYLAAPDGLTKHIRQLSEHWRDVATLSDDEIADAIHADGIDVLIDLAGHTERARLGVISQRPAPAQASWLGYLNTTGLTRMDYRLCDRRTDPSDVSPALHTERLVHLPESQWCYRPMADTPIAPVAPLEKNGFVTFGSFNSPLKITSGAVRRWGESMARVPQSRLIVFNVREGSKRDAILHDIGQAGVAADRVTFRGRVGLDKYLDLFNAVDIAFDTFPYGGGTTTLDALWMGVPVLATVGVTPVSRSAASVLRLLGLDDWVAPRVDDFVETAVARASDHAALVELRRTLRARMQASPLTDMPRFVRDLESAYRQMRDEPRA